MKFDSRHKIVSGGEILVEGVGLAHWRCEGSCPGRKLYSTKLGELVNCVILELVNYILLELMNCVLLDCINMNYVQTCYNKTTADNQ